MKIIDTVYINGQFVTSKGEEWFELINPATERVFGKVRLANQEDARDAVEAAKRAFEIISTSSVEERLDMLARMQQAVRRHEDELIEVLQLEYGAPVSRAHWMARYASDVIGEAAETLRSYEFTQIAGTARVRMEPVGVAGLITPWNSNAGFICNKLSMAIAAGCTAVIKPSEMSAWQTAIVSLALHEAGLPPGAFNIVTGRGEVVGEHLTSSPDVAKISFTGSTAVGKEIVRASAPTLKRVTLELGGKSPTIILDDADPMEIAPLVVSAGFANSGQACIAGTRILVPAARFAEYEAAIAACVCETEVGDPRLPETVVGPMVSAKQWERVQGYIQTGMQEGALVIVGGEGRPEGLHSGWFTKPTLFTDVRNDMTIAQEEIFGPVLCLIRYENEDEAVSIANDSVYGLSAVLVTKDLERGQALAARLKSGRVLINTLAHEPQAPFGGVKQSGLGRENGRWGLESFLEPKAVIGLA